MPVSCKSILNRMVHKGAMTEQERDKILRNYGMNTDREHKMLMRIKRECIKRRNCEGCRFYMIHNEGTKRAWASCSIGLPHRNWDLEVTE